jgi:hypothetical protein
MRLLACVLLVSQSGKLNYKIIKLTNGLFPWLTLFLYMLVFARIYETQKILWHLATRPALRSVSSAVFCPLRSESHCLVISETVARTMGAIHKFLRIILKLRILVLFTCVNFVLCSKN